MQHQCHVWKGISQPSTYPWFLRFPYPLPRCSLNLEVGNQTHCLGRHTQTSLFLKALTRCASLRSLTVIHCKRKLFWPRLRAPLIYEYEHKCLTICFFSKISVVALWTGLEFLVWTHGVGHKSRKIAMCYLQSNCATATASGLAGWYNIRYCFNGKQGPLLVETVDNFAFSAAFIIPSTPRKDIQKRENFWLNLSLIFFPCSITKVHGAFNNNGFPLNSWEQIEEIKEAANQWLHKLNENSNKYLNDGRENTNIWLNEITDKLRFEILIHYKKKKYWHWLKLRVKKL